SPYGLQIVHVLSDGDILIGGDFTNYGVTGKKRLIKVTPQGTLIGSFTTNLPDNFLFKTIAESGNNILIGVQPLEVTGKQLYCIDKTTGLINTTFMNNLGATNVTGVSEDIQIGVFAIKTLSNGEIVIGGSFSSVNGIAKNRIAKLTSSGTLSPKLAFNNISGLTNTIFSIETQLINNVEKILIGGSFFHSSTGRTGILRLSNNLVLDTSFTDPNLTPDKTVYSLKVQENNKIVIGGTFTSSGLTSRNAIARLHRDGNLDLCFNPGSGANSPIIYKVVIDNEENILLWGRYNSYNGVTKKNVAKVFGNWTAGNLIANNDTGSITTVGGTAINTVLNNDTFNGATATSTTVTPSITDINPLPAGGGFTMDANGKITVNNATPAGNYVITYQIQDNSNNCNITAATATITVTSLVLDAVNDAYGTNQIASCNGATFSSNILANDKINGFNLYPSSVARVNLTYSVSPAQSGITVNTTNGSSSKGTISVSPGVPAGIYVITYRITDVNFPQNYDEATVTLSLWATADAVNDAITVNSGVTTTNAINVISNDTYDCHPAASAPGVTISLVSAPITGIYLDTATGNISVDSTVAPGVYTLTYQICDKVFTPAYSCDTATVTITVAGPVTIDAVNDNLTVTLGSAATINIFTNDIYSGGITPTLLSSPGGGISVTISTGLVTVPSSTPAGTYSFTYQICQQGFPSNCDTAVVTITVGAGLRTKSNHDDAVIKENSVSIYPNPSEGIFNIDFKGYEEQKFDITIHNALGQLIYQGVITPENTNQIDLIRFESGSYFITLLNAKETINKVVIKK
ncbi:MAG: hypothetical protein DI539_09955, partial [Flavobacterium psychrophilum]